MASLQTYLRATLEGLTRATLALAVRSARVSRSGLRLRAVRAKLSRTCGGGRVYSGIPQLCCVFQGFFVGR